MHSGFALQPVRLDRHVSRTRVRMTTGVSQHRIAWSLEEALRLAHLPGEEEGRVYCFRRVSLTGIPAEALRPIWMEKVQQSLAALARRSVHGAEPGAVAADAIYFNNLEEALETLLRKTLRHTAGEPALPWFATSLLGVAAHTSCTALIPLILDRLNSAPTPGAAAAILFAALGDSDPATLLSSIPEDTVRAWLRALDESNTTADTAPIELPASIVGTLRRAAAQFGWRSPALLWLATQAVLSISPGTWMTGLAVKKARASLRHIESVGDRDALGRNLLRRQDNRSRIHGLDDDNPDSGIMTAPDLSISAREFERGPFLSLTNSAHILQSNRQSFVDAPQVDRAWGSIEFKITHLALLGESTHSAGLLFLLNGLRRTGIAAALQTHPVLATASLPAYILKRLAIDAGVADEDPIHLCLAGTDDPFTLPPEACEDVLPLDSAWPIGFAPLPSTPRTSDHLLRAWALAVSLWCRRHARLSTREIIQRRGRVSLTRTDVDVVLPLDQADVRIRRAGLDIDPGWLHWFGPYGKVVRFHYRDREPENVA
jgi:hypothetical protein